MSFISEQRARGRSEVGAQAAFTGVSVSAEKDFVDAGLVTVLHKLLSDEQSAPEIKYNSMILICAVMDSGEPHPALGLASARWLV